MSLVPDWCCGSPCPGADSGDSGSNGGGSLWDKIGDALGLAADDGEKKTNARSNTGASLLTAVFSFHIVHSCPPPPPHSPSKRPTAFHSVSSSFPPNQQQHPISQLNAPLTSRHPCPLPPCAPPV